MKQNYLHREFQLEKNIKINNLYDISLFHGDNYDLEIVNSDKEINSNVIVDLDLSNSDVSEQFLGDSDNRTIINNIFSQKCVDDCSEPIKLDNAYKTFSDVGLVDNIEDEIFIDYNIVDNEKFNPLYFDCRYKMNSINSSEEISVYNYNINGLIDNEIGYIEKLEGGFYQGFYALEGYDYEVLPKRFNRGFTVEMFLKPDLDPDITNTINNLHVDNLNTFFYMGTRAENKFNEEYDSKLDIFSNAFSVKFKGDLTNPYLCVRYLKYEGDCVKDENCEDESISYEEEFNYYEKCGNKGIYDVCDGIDEEKWVKIDIVFYRETYLEDCDLYNYGGVNDIINEEYTDAIDFIENKDSGITKTIELNKKWVREKDKRNGKLIIYVNGNQYMIIDDFEEIIPRELNVDKDEQIGVPFNISFGGGTTSLLNNWDIINWEKNYNLTYQYNPNMLLEKYFCGSFMGEISRMVIHDEPMNYAQLKHNFRINKNKYGLLDYNCPKC